MRRQRLTAFTLIELLVVIAIIALIAAILFPVFARVREKARQTVCLSNEKQIATAVRVYMQDYDEHFPFVLTWSGNWLGDTNVGDQGKRPEVPGYTGREPQFQLVNVVAPYVKNSTVWYCPSVGPDFVWEAAVRLGSWKKGATMRDQGTTYQYTYVVDSWPQDDRRVILMAGKPDAILREPSRWPMLYDQPTGYGFSGNVGDPPPSAQPHSGGTNVAYGDGHARFYRMEAADGGTTVVSHWGDGVIPGQ
jgi:prepilin-type processing-associated H-X9-DG protein/prepilin-type N-terminal cleavage/methylation domain-containing protein